MHGKYKKNRKFEFIFITSVSKLISLLDESYCYIIFLFNYFVPLDSIMPIATRGKVQSQIAFPCRKTRSHAVKGDGAKKKSTSSQSKATSESTRESRMRKRNSRKRAESPEEAASVDRTSENSVLSPRKRPLSRGNIILVSYPDLNCMVSYGTYTSNTHRIKSGDDCDELDADWMTACQLFLEIYDTHNYLTQK